MAVHPSSVRFDGAVAARLARFVQRHTDLSASAAVNRLVDEGLRMEEHPGVFFRGGPAGRRAVLIGGPDVWEVVRAVRHARAAAPDLVGGEVVDLVVTNTGTSRPVVEQALAYWAAHPVEVDAAVEDADRAEREELAGRERRQDLLFP